MDEESFEAELERRLDLLADPASDESALADLPGVDLWLAVAGIVALCVLTTWWGYPG